MIPKTAKSSKRYINAFKKLHSLNNIQEVKTPQQIKEIQQINVNLNLHLNFSLQSIAQSKSQYFDNNPILIQDEQEEEHINQNLSLHQKQNKRQICSRINNNQSLIQNIINNNQKNAVQYQSSNLNRNKSEIKQSQLCSQILRNDSLYYEKWPFKLIGFILAVMLIMIIFNSFSNLTYQSDQIHSLGNFKIDFSDIPLNEK